MLIPLYLIIGVWGGPRRVYASVKLFLYTLMGSLLMLVAIVYLSYQVGGFSIEDFKTSNRFRWACNSFCLWRFPVICGESADVPCAHLAAGCPR